MIIQNKIIFGDIQFTFIIFTRPGNLDFNQRMTVRGIDGMLINVMLFTWLDLRYKVYTWLNSQLFDKLTGKFRNIGIIFQNKLLQINKRYCIIYIAKF